MSLGNYKSSSRLSSTILEINEFLEELMEEMGNETLLCVTGNKGAQFKPNYYMDPLEETYETKEEYLNLNSTIH